MPLIFVNYRTDDGEATATLMDQELSRVFGRENVFRASKSIEAGSRFPQELLTAVRRSSVLLAVIGTRWREVGGTDGRSALENEGDWTRREIFEALETGAVVIPLLVGGAERLRSQDLPADIADLADCQYLRFSHRNAEADLKALIERLLRLPELAAAARSSGYAPEPAPPAQGDGGAGDSRVRAGVIRHRQRGGIGNVNGDFTGTFVSEPQGPVHAGTGHIYQGREQHLGPRISNDGGTVNYVADNHGNVVADNHGEVDQSGYRDGRPADGQR
ncbi:TIR domain-containing protein [Streptomyces sp. NPDC014779]|uniref:TIR domain-containing protein n=1 Tax=Streptomyces sp. NPDC014779 TaxID=3364911 RepID=UPI0036F9A820